MSSRTFDPDNRLVTDELERRWNHALGRARESEQRIADHDNTKPSGPTPDLADFTALAERLETLWEHPDTDPRLKKRIVRSLIHEIVVDLDAAASEVVLVIHWVGGVHTEVRVPRRRRGQNTSHTAPETIDARTGHTRTYIRTAGLPSWDEYACSGPGTISPMDKAFPSDH